MTTPSHVNDLHFAVVVGIDRYPAFTDLKTARGDAEKIREWLGAAHGGALPDSNIRLIRGSDDGAELENVLPTQREVNAALKAVQDTVRDKIRSDTQAWERTRLYIFVAGHGIMPRDGRGALLMADATPEMLGLHIDLHRYLLWQEENALFKEIMIFADCCRIPRNCQFAYSPPFTSEPAERKPVAVLAYATGAGQPSRARFSGEGRGLFTEALLEALEGRATNSDGDVTLDQIETYIKQKLQPANQISEFIPSRNATVVVRVTPRERAVRFIFPLGNLLVELLHGDGTSEVIFVDEPICTRVLNPGLYQITPITPGVQAFVESGRFRIYAGNELVDVRL